MNAGCRLCVFILLISQGSWTKPLDSYKMTFPCGVDICSVPKHFCDTVTSTCENCNSDICNGDIVDPMCNYVCEQLKNPEIETSTQTPVEEPLTALCPARYEGVFWPVVGSETVVIVILVPVIGILVYKFIYRKKKLNTADQCQTHNMVTPIQEQQVSATQSEQTI